MSKEYKAFIAGFTMGGLFVFCAGFWIVDRMQPEFAIYTICPPATSDKGIPHVTAEVHTRLDAFHDGVERFKIFPDVTLNGGKITGIILTEEDKKTIEKALAGERSKKVGE